MYKKRKKNFNLLMSLTACMLFQSTVMTKTIFARDISSPSNYSKSINTGFEVKYYANWNLENLQAISVSQDRIGSRISLNKLQDHSKWNSVRVKGYIDPTYVANNHNLDSLLIGIQQNKNVRVYINKVLMIDKFKGSSLNNEYVTVPIVKRNGSVEPIEVVLEYSIMDYNPIPNSIDLMYKTSKYNQSNYFREQDILPPKDEEEISTTSTRMTRSIDLDSDLDHDSIPDTWEREGYTWNKDSFTLEKWDPSKHSEAQGFIKYKTSPLAFSTDGDPYGDYAEVTGIRMDNSVSKEGKHPLVAAYPRIKVSLDTLDIVPEQGLQTKNGRDIADTISNSLQKTDTHAFEHSYSESLGFKVGHTFSATPSTNIEFSMNFTAGQKIADTNATAVANSTSNQKTIKWEETTSTTANDAAHLKLNLHYENNGTASISNVVPTISISQMSKSIATIKMPISAQALEMAPDSRYPRSGDIRVQYENDGRTPIKLDIDQLNNIMAKRSFELRTDQIQGDIRKEKENGEHYIAGTWQAQMTQINAATADISLQFPNQKIKRTKIAAYDPSDVNNRNNPKTTLKDAIVCAFNGQIIGNNIFIDGERVENGWMISMSAETQREIKAQLNKMHVPNLFDVELRPNMNILLQKPDPSKKPIIEGAFLNENGKSLSVYTVPSLYAIKGVSANVEINGSMTILNLVQSTIDPKLWTAPINGTINVIYDSTVSVTDIKERSNTVKLQIPYGFTPPVPKGLLYIPDRMYGNKLLTSKYNIYDIRGSRAIGAKALVLRSTLKNVVGPKVEMRIGDNIIKGGMSGNLIKATGEQFYGYIGDRPLDRPQNLDEWAFREMVQEFSRVFKTADYPFNLNISSFNEELNDDVDNIQFYDINSLKSVIPRSSGIVFFEHNNYGGRAEGINFNTNGFQAWCAARGNFAPSSYKYVNHYAPKYAPMHDFNMIVTMDELFKYMDTNLTDVNNGFDKNVNPIGSLSSSIELLNLHMEGYFSKLPSRYFSGSKLTIFDTPKSHTITDLNHLYNINTQERNAKAYMIKVTSEKISSDKIEIMFNGEYPINLGVSDTQGFGMIAGTSVYSPTHSETFILNANPNNPAIINTTVSINDYKQIRSGANVKIEILGVFTEDGEAYYNIFDTPYKLENIGTNDTTGDTITLDGSKFVAKPKGYMLKVTANNATSDILRLNIDGASVDLGTAATKNVNGKEPYGVDHSGLMFVPADSTPYRLDMSSEFNKDFVDHGYYDIEMIGYYY